MVLPTIDVPQDFNGGTVSKKVRVRLRYQYTNDEADEADEADDDDDDDDDEEEEDDDDDHDNHDDDNILWKIWFKFFSLLRCYSTSSNLE